MYKKEKLNVIQKNKKKELQKKRKQGKIEKKRGNMEESSFVFGRILKNLIKLIKTVKKISNIKKIGSKIFSCFIQNIFLKDVVLCSALFFLLCFCIGGGCLPHAAQADVVVNINKGVMKRISIAISVFDPHHSVLKSQISRIITDDLQSTYLFRAIPEKAFMQNLNGLSTQPQFSNWRSINAQYLVNIEVQRVKDQSDDGADQLTLQFHLYDVLSQMLVGRFSVTGRALDLRKMSHLAANSIYERITGERGYFDTKFLYVAVNKGAKGAKTYRLAIMDQDGYNHQYLTSGNTLVLTPRFSPNGRECAYFTYREKIVNGRRVPISASVYRYGLYTGRISLISHFNGMSYAPRYSPDGRKLIFSLSSRGSSSINVIDLETGQSKKLTSGRCIDTSPCYSPDGKHIVFNSDRDGAQQLYIMDSDGSNVRRLSFSKGRYATPVWSPRGDWIAFTKFGIGGFYIGVIRPDGSGERMLAAGNLVEGPTWSPNGRVVMYTNQDYAGRSKLYSVDITGYNKREVKTPGEGIDPEWSARGM